MTKVRLKQNTDAGKKGDIVDLGRTAAEIYLKEDLAEEVSEESLKEETPNIADEVGRSQEKTGSSEGDGPIWSERIVMKQNKRNITPISN